MTITNHGNPVPPERRFRCTACGGEFDEMEVTCPAGQYHCGPCVPIIEFPTGEEAEAARLSQIEDRDNVGFLRDLAGALEQMEQQDAWRSWGSNAVGELRDVADLLTAQATTLAALRKESQTCAEDLCDAWEEIRRLRAALAPHQTTEKEK